ncbi:unnamed protein product, partial [Ostreobium quekettii]
MSKKDGAPGDDLSADADDGTIKSMVTGDEEQTDEDKFASFPEALVCDNGTGFLKAGAACLEGPEVVMPLITGEPRFRQVMCQSSDRVYVGEAARRMGSVLALKNPMKNGQIDDFEQMERIWFDAFYSQLQVDTSCRPMLVSEPPLNSRASREKVAAIMFEQFNLPALAICTDAVLALYAHGRTTGLVIDCGHAISHTACVYNGSVLTSSARRLMYGGDDVTRHLARLLMVERGHRFESASEMESVRAMKEARGSVATEDASDLDGAQPDDESPEGAAEAYSLPDGQLVVPGAETRRCSEALFHPHLLGIDNPGLSEAALSSVLKCPEELQDEMFGSVAVSGGPARAPGFRERMQNDLRSMAAGRGKGVRLLPGLGRGDPGEAVW